MTKKDLFEGCKGWLEEEKMNCDLDPENLQVRVHLTGNSGSWDCKILCEDDPLMWQMISGLPLLVPAAKMEGASLLLHNINMQLRLGAFGLNTEKGGIIFRVQICVQEGASLADQFEKAFLSAFLAFDQAFRPLALFLCDTEETNQVLSPYKPKSESGLLGCATNLRVEFN